MWSAIALSIGLAMDAMAVSAARGLAQRNPRELVILPLVFGLFQAGMAAAGWAAGAWVGPYIETWDHWVAFGLLVAIGGKMLAEAWRGGDPDDHPPGTLSVYLLLGIATSIDAAAAGLTLPLVPVAPAVSLVLIGAVTAACSVLGYLAGRAIGHRVGPRLGALGGVVLICIGVNILLQGL